MEMELDNHSIDIAVVQEKVKVLEDNVCELQENMKSTNEMTHAILENHLPHLSTDIQGIKGAVDLLGEKVSPAIRLVYGAVGAVLLAVVGALIAVVLR